MAEEDEMTTEEFKAAYDKLPHVIERKEIDAQIENIGKDISDLIGMLDSEERREYFKAKFNKIMDSPGGQ